MERHTLEQILAELAPEYNPKDNLPGTAEQEERQFYKIGVCIDPTVRNIKAAAAKGIELLLSYHPWRGEAAEIVQTKALELLTLDTAWDNAAQGINYTFAKAIGLSGLNIYEGILFGKNDTNLRELLERCQRVLEINILPYGGELNSLARKVGIWAGPGFLPQHHQVWETCQAQGCDTILSSELSRLALKFAELNSLNIVDLGHSAMAKPSLVLLTKTLQEKSFDCSFEFLPDFYSCNFYTTNCFQEQFEAEETLSLFSVTDNRS